MRHLREDHDGRARQWDGTGEGIERIDAWMRDGDLDADPPRPADMNIPKQVNYRPDVPGEPTRVFVTTEAGMSWEVLAPGQWVIRNGDGPDLGFRIGASARD